MKKSQLKNIIRKSIKELINEQGISVPGHKTVTLEICPASPDGVGNVPLSVGSAGVIQCNGQECTQSDIGQEFTVTTSNNITYIGNLVSFSNFENCSFHPINCVKYALTTSDTCNIGFPILDPADPLPNKPTISPANPPDPIEFPDNTGLLDPADPLPNKPTTSPNLLDCDKFYAMSQQQQDGCCMKCQDPNIGPNHQCYPYCHCCSKLRERFQKLANI